MDKKTVWLRLGGTVSATEEELRKIVKGDIAALLKVIEKDGFTVNGETYIPGECVDDLCEENGWDPEESRGDGRETGDVDFALDCDLHLACKTAKEGKELLRIVNVKEAICETGLNATTSHEKAMVGASILSLMDLDQEFATLVLQYVSLFLARRSDIEKLNRIAMRNAEIKTKN